MNQEVLTEWLNEDSGYCFRTSKPILDFHSGFQHIQLYESPRFGKVLRLDGCFMTSEKDEFFYHENIVHPASISHPALRRVLVIGGGDGGACEEVLKHPSVEKVVLAELDQAVVDVSKEHLGSIHRGAMDDPRFELRIGDGAAFVRETEERFDLIILDLTDPLGEAVELYKQEFFQACRAVLNPGGALTMHIGSPVFHPERVTEITANLGQVFAIVRPYLVTVPLYGAQWGFACASDTLDPLSLSEQEVDSRIAERKLQDLQFYNGATHRGVFALPNFVKQLVGEQK
ncbi:MAG: polyamine aminopropyltransferase [Gammaproteobacteria bacterium]|nr:polyamine aminopropyltransferase [Gammaproteobacteria bacterium]MBU1623609.1 polyamine aminopropyltransferase [Gammaproteobacteria bacterium]